MWAMANETVEKQFYALMLALKARLKLRGFAKQGQKFRRVIDGNAALIEVQRSVWSDSATIRLTLNMYVISARLLGPGLDVRKVGGARAQLRQRIGFFLPDPHDKWWELTGSVDDAEVIDEILRLVTENALPFLNSHSSDEGLAALWETGISPGIIDRQRVKFLHQLRAAE
jgi:hypothetical protein